MHYTRRASSTSRRDGSGEDQHRSSACCEVRGPIEGGQHELEFRVLRSYWRVSGLSVRVFVFLISCSHFSYKPTSISNLVRPLATEVMQLFQATMDTRKNASFIENLNVSSLIESN